MRRALSGIANSSSPGHAWRMAAKAARAASRPTPAKTKEGVPTTMAVIRPVSSASARSQGDFCRNAMVTLPVTTRTSNGRFETEGSSSRDPKQAIELLLEAGKVAQDQLENIDLARTALQAVLLEPLDHAILGPAGDHDTSTRSVDGLVMQAVGSDVVAVEVCQLAARTDSHGVASVAARRGPQGMSVGFVEVLHQ